MRHLLKVTLAAALVLGPASWGFCVSGCGVAAAAVSKTACCCGSRAGGGVPVLENPDCCREIAAPLSGEGCVTSAFRLSDTAPMQPGDLPVHLTSFPVPGSGGHFPPASGTAVAASPLYILNASLLI